MLHALFRAEDQFGIVIDCYGFVEAGSKKMCIRDSVRPSDVVIAKETCAEGIYYRVRKTVGNGDFFSVTSFGKR